MENDAIFITDEIIADGQIHRFYQGGDKSGSKNGWYVLYIDGIPAGAYGCWKRDIEKTWCYKPEQQLTIQEKFQVQKIISEARNKREVELTRLQNEAQERANNIWQQSVPLTIHPYLKNKSVQSYGLRLYKNNLLIIPILDQSQQLHSLQFINSEGQKRFLSNGKIHGHFYSIGEITSTLYLCEGYATAATIYQASRCATFVAFNANNLLPVAKVLKTNYPNHQIMICADNDQWSPNNPGLTKAQETAKYLGAQLFIPQFKSLESKPSDFNDLANLEGMETVHKQLGLTCDSHQASDQKISLANQVLQLLADAEFFHDEQGETYVTFLHRDRYETWPIESKEFQESITHLYWRLHQKVINKTSLQDVLAVINGKARFEGACHKVFIRVGHLGDTIYLDLANESCEIVEINLQGWKILPQAPIKFRRSRSMRPLPRPEKEGSIDLLWELINIPPQSQKLVLAWLLECLRPDTHFPILVLTGLQGSAKSSTQYFLRELIDPSTSNLRGTPRKSEDLFVAAVNNWLVSLNNISRLSASQQDDLCCLATGGGFATRKLYSTMEEEVAEIKRPVIMNGIHDFISAQDLIDRAIVLELPPILVTERKTDQELQQRFSENHGRFLGALLTTLSQILKELPNVRLDEKPRLADFAQLGVALEHALAWEPGSFIRDYLENRKVSITSAMEHSSLATAIIQFMEEKGSFSGLYSQLYNILSKSYKHEKALDWPRSARGLAMQLKRQCIALTLIGIHIEFEPQRQKDGFHVHLKDIRYNVHQVH